MTHPPAIPHAAVNSPASDERRIHLAGADLAHRCTPSCGWSGASPRPPGLVLDASCMIVFHLLGDSRLSGRRCCHNQNGRSVPVAGNAAAELLGHDGLAQ